GSVSTPSGTSEAAARSRTRSDVERTVPAGNRDLAFTTVIMAGPSGAAAETPVSTAAAAASTASFLRCHDAARASARSGRGRVGATEGMGRAGERKVLVFEWSCLDVKDAHSDRARRPQG